MGEQFQEGDVVQLKSGGPKMTINKIEDWDGGRRAWCKWFQGTDSKEDVFPVSSLKLPDDPPRQGSLRPVKTGSSWS
jgi:uncharacterized protein YodC (DUF2158 family)